MRQLFKNLAIFAVVQVAIQLGSAAGTVLRGLFTGQPRQVLGLRYRDEAGNIIESSPMLTHSLPGITLALVVGRKNRPWLWGFTGSFVAALALGDTLEKRLVEAILRRIEAVQAKR
jgi:hypothetical protein